MSDTSRIVRTPRVYDLAREIGVGSHVVKNLLNTLGFGVKSPSSRVNIEFLDESPIFMQLFTDTCIDTYRASFPRPRVSRPYLLPLATYIVTYWTSVTVHIEATSLSAAAQKAGYSYEWLMQHSEIDKDSCLVYGESGDLVCTIEAMV